MNRIGYDAGSHGELDRRGVDDAHNIARAGSGNDTEEGSVHSILRVKLDHLLVVVRTLQELDACIQRSAICSEEDLDAADARVERIGAQSTALDRRASLKTLLGGLVDVAMGDVCLERELYLTDVTHGDGVRTSRGLDNGTERTDFSILTVDPHLHRCVVRARPELNVGVERAAFSLHVDLNLLNGRITVRPGSQGATLNPDQGSVLACLLSDGYGFVSDARLVGQSRAN